MEVFQKYMQKPLYSYKHASISVSVHNGPFVLTTPIWIVSFESLSHGCSTRYFKSNIFEYCCNPKLSKGVTWGFLNIIAEVFGSLHPHNRTYGLGCILYSNLLLYLLSRHDSWWCYYRWATNLPKKWNELRKYVKITWI